MKWLFIFIPFIYIFSCQKPFNPDTGNNIDSIAIFTLLSSANNCSHIIPVGIYKEKKKLDSLNKIMVDVNVTKTGSWTAATNIVNGILFSGSGIFNRLGGHTVILQGIGLPLLKGGYSFIITSGNRCNFILQVASDSLPTNNLPPVADAGPDTSFLFPVNNVTLTGKGKDFDGVISSFQWKKIAGPASFAIMDPNSGTTTISQLEEGVYQFELTVTDNLGALGKDTVSIKIIQISPKGSLFVEQELDATSPVNDTMNYSSGKLTNITSNYHLQKFIYYENNKISKIDYWYNDISGNSVEKLIHTFYYDAAGNVIQIFETQIPINTTFLHQEFFYNSDNTLHERKTHFLGGRILRDNIFLYTEGNLTTLINLTPDNMGPPDTILVTYDSRINNFKNIYPQYFLLDALSDYYVSLSNEIFYFSKNYPVSFGLSHLEISIDPSTRNPYEIRINNILILRYIYN